MSGLAAGIGVSIDGRITLNINWRANKSDLCQQLPSPPQRPFCRFSKKSLRGPSMTKSVTRNQLVWRLSSLPLLLATAYLMYSFGFSSVPAVWGPGVSAKWLTMVMRATERGAVVPMREQLQPWRRWHKWRGGTEMTTWLDMLQ